MDRRALLAPTTADHAAPRVAGGRGRWTGRSGGSAETIARLFQAMPGCSIGASEATGRTGRSIWMLACDDEATNHRAAMRLPHCGTEAFPPVRLTADR